MKSSFRRIIASFLFVFYLFAGHAAVHGLSWCLAADDHAHLEQVTGHCATPAMNSFCSAEESCAPMAVIDAAADEHEERSECHHLPTSSPHRSTCTQRVERAEDRAADALISVTVPAPAFTVVAAPPLVRHEVEHLPPRQALTALRTIVLTC